MMWGSSLSLSAVVIVDDVWFLPLSISSGCNREVIVDDVWFLPLYQQWL
jgi:hypothetical protein